MNPTVILADAAAPAFDPFSLTLEHAMARWWLVWTATGLAVNAVLASGSGRSAWRRRARVPPATWPPRETGALVLLILSLALAAAACAQAASVFLPQGAGAPEWAPLLCHALIVQTAGGLAILARLRLYGERPREILRGPSPSLRRDAATAFVLLLAISPFADLAQIAFPHLVRWLGWDLEPQALPMQFLLTESPWTLALIAGVALGLAPFFEELLFRGLLYRSLRPVLGPVPAAVATAALFALIHGNLSVFPGLLILGLGLALACELTGSLATAILLHAGFNLRSLLMMIALRGTIS